jgi:anti-sigma factor RsiW
MMEYQEQLKLQAYLDGELSESEARKVTEWLGRDREAAALLNELRQTHDALAGFEEGMRLPESREFYWSRIQREILRQEAPAPAQAAVPWLIGLRRMLVPLSGVALVVLAGLLASNVFQSTPFTVAETALADSGAFTYHDYTSGTTVVWLSYPADNEIAESAENSISVEE